MASAANTIAPIRNFKEIFITCLHVNAIRNVSLRHRDGEYDTNILHSKKGSRWCEKQHVTANQPACNHKQHEKSDQKLSGSVDAELSSQKWLTRGSSNPNSG